MKNIDNLFMYLRNMDLKERIKKNFGYSAPSSKPRKPRKILFDHLPKCGGSSLVDYLKRNYPQEKIFSINGINPKDSISEFKTFSLKKRHEYDLIQGHSAYQLIDYVHPACMKITVFREPVDRIVSPFYYARRSKTHYLHSKIWETDMQLEDYATSNLSGELRNYYTTRFSGLMLADAEQNPEKAIEKAIEVVLNRYEIFGFLEDFFSFTERLRGRGNLKYEYQNKKVNVTSDRPNIDRIAPSTVKLIEQVNHLDISFYRKAPKTVLSCPKNPSIGICLYED